MPTTTNKSSTMIAPPRVNNNRNLSFNNNNNNNNQLTTQNQSLFNRSYNNSNNNNNNTNNTYNGYRSSMEFYRLKLSKSKLKAVTKTSALLSGFAMVAMVELNLDYSDYIQAAAQGERALKIKRHQNQILNASMMNNSSSTISAALSIFNTYNNYTNITNSSSSTTTTTTTTTMATNYLTKDEQMLFYEQFIVPHSILVIYSIVTCLLVGVHMLALMISTCILPQIEASSFDVLELEHHQNNQNNQNNHQQRANKIYEANELLDSNHHHHHHDQEAAANENEENEEDEESAEMLRKPPNLSKSSQKNTNFILNASTTAAAAATAATTSTEGINDISVNHHHHENNHEIISSSPYFIFPYGKFHRFIELAWISSTVLGIFLFLVEIGLVCYIKFYPISFIAAISGALVMLPILILFVLFTITFYKRVAGFKVNLTKTYLDQVDRNLMPLNDTTVL